MTGAGDSRRFFDGIARRYDRVYAKDREASQRSVGRVISALASTRRGERARVLDLGVGTGRELSGLLDAGLQPTGLDASDEMLALCARRTRPVPLVKADLWQPLPFDDGSFEGVIALHGTLAHPPDEGSHARLAAEVLRVLTPGGAFVAEVPSPAWLEAATGERQGDFVLRRTGPDRCVHEDLMAGVAIEVIVLPPIEWRKALAAFQDVSISEEMQELCIVARR